MPNGIMTVSVAAWLFTNAETQNIASAKVHGAYWTMLPIFSTRNPLFAETKVSLIQAMPKIETTAIMPALKTLEFAISFAFTLVANRMMAPKASITIWTTVVIGIGLPFMSGRSSASRPGVRGGVAQARRTMDSTPEKKSVAESFAVSGSPCRAW